MKIFETNLGLGYGEVAYFIETKDKEYLCISENEDTGAFNKMYSVGEVAEFEDYDIGREYGLIEVIPEKHQMILDNSPLSGTWLFKKFLADLEG